jgi:Uma2 family endonuclease
MASNAAVAENLSDILAELGGIPVDRVHREPTPGRATIDDLVRLNNNGSQCELVDGTLVEKAMGWRESLIAALLVELIGGYARRNNLGVVTGADGFIQLLGSLVRGPDVAFISWARLPDGQIPQDAIPQIVPDLAVEVISVGNTLTEMSRKRREYFHAGVRLVWMVDPRERTVAVYTSINDYEILDEDQVLRGHDVVPGLEIQLAEVFAELDRQRPQG